MELSNVGSSINTQYDSLEICFDDVIVEESMEEFQVAMILAD
jgi:hypothetical protein